MTGRLALCADDFGTSPGISEAIAELAAGARLSAVSCLANAPHWASGARLLPGLTGRVDVGLHFNLTEGVALSADLKRIWSRLPALARVSAMAHLGALPRAAIDAEFAAQLEAFAGAFGAMPAFVDGHQHVHHLPCVREVVLDALGRLATMPAVRNTGRVIGPGHRIKRALIEGTGGRALQARLVHRGIAHNAALTGVYDFAAADYRALMQGWLAEVPADGALLFCHPGGPSDDAARDPIAGARRRELAYLRSDDFLSDLRTAGIETGPVWRVASTA